MALLETLMFDLGASITKSLLKMWLKEEIASGASSTVVDAIKTLTKDRINQHRAQKQLEEIGMKVGESLLPIFERDGAHLDDGSRTAIALAVAETLNTLSGKILAEKNLDSGEIAQFLYKHPKGIEHFNDTELFLFKKIISETCDRIVDIATQFPSVTERSLSEILKRDNYLIAIAEQTLNDVQRILKQTNPHLGAEEFEIKYLRAVLNKLDTLELFGVDLPPASQRHKLSTAYISLFLEEKALSIGKKMIISSETLSIDLINPPDIYATNDREKKKIVSVEVALTSSHRLFISGTAGSGKTTLLQWIAVNAARKTFKESLAQWNKCLPFYISLRHCVEGGFPPPEVFPKFITQAIVATMPTGWVHKALENGQAIILVDGLDEVPEVQRMDVQLWLKDLVEN